jgi:NitT/TauT family transport system permease protein
MENRCEVAKLAPTVDVDLSNQISVKNIFSMANVFFVIAIIITFIPGRMTKGAQYEMYLFGLLMLIEVVYIGQTVLKRNDETVKKAPGDIACVVYAFLIVWEILTSKFDLLQHLLFPVPGKVVATFVEDIPVFAECLLSSLKILSAGYILALVVAIPLALIIGWRKRLYAAVNPMTKILGPIPPTVYIPYAIAILPTFMMSSIFIIFVGAFWPVFINTLNGTFTVDKRLIDSARVLNVSERTMLFRIILPGILPAIISGATLGLVFSFILLTAAEMIGASSGLGWYVKYFSDFADYPRVVAGIVFIGIVVTVITQFFELIEKRLLKWRD